MISKNEKNNNQMPNVKKNINIKIVILILIILLVIGTFLIIKLSSKKGTYIYYINSDNELKYAYNDIVVGVIDKNYEDSIFDITTSENNKLAVYIKNNDLYKYEFKSKEKSKIAVDVKNYWISNDNILYLTTDNELIYYKKKDEKKNKIDVEVGTVEYINSNIILYRKEKSLIYYNLKNEEKITLSNNVNFENDNSYFYISKNYKYVLYSAENNDDKTNDLYKFIFKDKTNAVLIKSIEKILDIDETTNKILYLKKAVELGEFKVMFTDDMAESDAKLEEELSSCKELVNAVSYLKFGDKYYYNNSPFYGTEAYDIEEIKKEEYDKCYLNKYGLDFRNEIRENHMDGLNPVNYYDVYMNENGKDKLLYSTLSEVSYGSIKNNLVFNYKYEYDSNNVSQNPVKFSDLMKHFTLESLKDDQLQQLEYETYSTGYYYIEKPSTSIEKFEDYAKKQNFFPKFKVIEMINSTPGDKSTNAEFNYSTYDVTSKNFVNKNLLYFDDSKKNNIIEYNLDSLDGKVLIENSNLIDINSEYYDYLTLD